MNRRRNKRMDKCNIYSGEKVQIDIKYVTIKCLTQELKEMKNVIKYIEFDV